MLRPIAALSLCCVLLTGCVDAAKRAIIAEEQEKERDLSVTLIKDITEVDNGGAMQVDGIGLVKGLQGTGHSPDGAYRKMMEQYLLKYSGKSGGELAHLEPQVRVREILDDPCNAIVIVTGFIPPGARKGDRFDVNIKLPPYSKATSLAGGYLELCTLRIWEAAANLSNSPKHQNSSQLLPGHIFAHAKGKLVVGFGGNTDVNELKHAKVWQGGVARIDRPYLFLMRKDERALEYSSKIASRINLMYLEDPKARQRQSDFSESEQQLLAMGYAAHSLNAKQDPYGMGQGDIAKPTKDKIIYVRVPYGYRLDPARNTNHGVHQRFVDVVSLTPFNDVDADIARYKQRLEKMLLEPRDTRRAALRLEAMGSDTIPVLKTGLESNHPFVRFCAAESLTYLGNTAGVETLAQLARKYPILAKHATIALANLNESFCRDRLADLLAADDPALRCAAFDALAVTDETDSRLRGAVVGNETFWLYQLSQAPNQMVYFSTSRRPQVVLFGNPITLKPGPGVIIPKDFTVTHDSKSNKFLIKRITASGVQQRESTGNLAEILTNLAYLGATYPEVVDFLRRINDYHMVNCPIVAWTTPEVSLETLLEEGRNLK
jgi:hypothetical protein